MSFTIRSLCSTLLLAAVAFTAGSGHAAPVSLGYASTGTAVHEYFAADPAIAAWAQVQARSGSWALQTDSPQTVEVASLWLGTGPAVPECCASDVQDFVFALTVAGVTQSLTARIQAREISNDQYQFDLLATPAALFDLGSLGVLSVQLLTGAGQMPANQPLYEASWLRAVAQFVEPPQAVPVPGTLALVLPALLALRLLRRCDGLTHTF